MPIDTKYNYDSLPYNIIDKNNFNNRQGLKPSYQIRKKKIIWLNTAFASSNISASNVYYEFTFNTPSIDIFENTKLRVISFVSNENTARPLIIKIKNLLYDYNSTYSADGEGFPILYVSHGGAIGMLLNNEFSLNLQAQTINSIVIKVNDSFTSRDTGYNISSQGVGHFILCLELEYDDLIKDDISSSYK